MHLLSPAAIYFKKDPKKVKTKSNSSNLKKSYRNNLSLYSCGQPCLEINHWFTLNIGTFKKEKTKQKRKKKKAKKRTPSLDLCSL